MSYRLPALLRSAAFGAGLALSPIVLLSLIVLVVSRGLSQPRDILFRTLPFLLPAGIVVGATFLRRRLFLSPRLNCRTLSAAILLSIALAVAFAFAVRSAQSLRFNITVLRPAFAPGTDIATVRSRLGAPRAEHSAATFPLSSFAPCDVRTAVTVLEYSHPDVPDARFFYFDRSGALLCDGHILIWH